MNWKKIIGIILGFALIAVFVIKLRSNKKITEEKVFQYNKEQAINVQTDTVEIEKVNDDISFSGTFEPNKETKISAETQGKINKVFVDVGSVVNKGQSLIQLDHSLLKLQLQTIEVQIEGLEIDVNRYTILANADAIQGIQLEKSILGLKTAKIQKATLIEQINKTIIKAPFNGIITAKLSEEGAFASPGIPLLQLTDITNLKFIVNVPENDLNLFKLYQNYEIRTDVYSEILLLGKSTMIGSKANLGSSFPVQFSLSNTNDLKIKSGMFGKVYFKNHAQEKGIIISTSAIIGSENHAQVYIIRNGKSILKNITISKKIQNKAVVKSGLKEGDIIVTNGYVNLFDGANVLIKNKQ